MSCIVVLIILFTRFGLFFSKSFFSIVIGCQNIRNLFLVRHRPVFSGINWSQWSVTVYRCKGLGVL
jgi:hypothetical protein